jgi:hypothetical protein
MDSHQSLLTVQPKRWYRWWVALFAIPFSAFLLSVWSLGLTCALTGWKPGIWGLLGFWAALAAVGMPLAQMHDLESLTWTLTTTDLRRGKRWPRVVFRLDEIESIVIGIPLRIPWFFWWAWVVPGFRSNWALMRRVSIFVRLCGGRRIPLNFLSGVFLNGPQMMEVLARLDAAKVVGHETYTGQELSKMQRLIFLNRVFTV